MHARAAGRGWKARHVAGVELEEHEARALVHGRDEGQQDDDKDARDDQEHAGEDAVEAHARRAHAAHAAGQHQDDCAAAAAAHASSFRVFPGFRGTFASAPRALPHTGLLLCTWQGIYPEGAQSGQCSGFPVLAFPHLAYPFVYQAHPEIRAIDCRPSQAPAGALLLICHPISATILQAPTETPGLIGRRQGPSEGEGLSLA